MLPEITVNKLIERFKELDLESNALKEADSKTLKEQETQSIGGEDHFKKPFTKKDVNFVLLNIPSGKPSRKKPNERVRQSSQKGDTCYYYALKVCAMLDPNYLKLQSEKNRKLASRFRKKITDSHIEKTESIKIIKTVLLIQFNDEDFNFMMQSKNKETVIQHFMEFMESPLFHSTQSEDDRESFKEIIDEFIKSNSFSMLDFLNARKSATEMAAAIEFLQLLGLDPEQEILKYHNNITEEYSKMNIRAPNHKKMSSPKELNEHLTLAGKKGIYMKVVELHMTQIFNLKESPWKPINGIELLYNLIKNSGKPMIIGGYFGVIFYSDINKAKKTIGPIEHYHVFGFAKGTHLGISKIYEYDINAHAIAVIGIEMTPESNTTKGYVYFLDPNDESIANKPRVVYKLSYEQFCKYCIPNTVKEMNSEDANTRIRKKSSFGYI